MSDTLVAPDGVESVDKTPALKLPVPPRSPSQPKAAPVAQDEEKRTPRSLRSWLLIALGTLLALAAVLYFSRNLLLGTPTPVYAATSSELVQTVVASGRVISPQRVTVALQGSGRVLRVAVAEGQTVERGQLLIELDNSDARATLVQASATVAQAQARLRQLRELSQPLAAQALAQAQASALQTRKVLVRDRDLEAAD